MFKAAQAASTNYSTTFKAYAKVNLVHSVSYPPENGYHAVQTIFQPIDLYDTLHFYWSHESIDSSATKATTKLGTCVHISCKPAECAPIPAEYLTSIEKLPCKENLIFKAIDLMEQRFQKAFAPEEMLSLQNSTQCSQESLQRLPPQKPQSTKSAPQDAMNEVFIQVEKAIPAGGGLGGGSSDAACVIKAYAQVHNIDPCSKECIEVAQALGSDVAGFLYENATWMCGKGDTLKKQLPNFCLPIVLMGSSEGNSTAEIYASFDENPQIIAAVEDYVQTLMQAAQSVHQNQSLIAPNNDKALALAQACSNNLQKAACSKNKQLALNIEHAMTDENVLNALVAGSGSSSFAICATQEAAQRFTNKAQQFCDWACIVHGSFV